ncbi:FUSC family protein [Sphingomonas sanguinis]|uniref:FUSC family protein n=1 Tax=Sphingomonas sanguinis TaxID=33051 RepID=A0ABU5LND9_9SPHN|nr:FUSC family protein [Sphingomonas sanguinis]MDZ7281458.1 FUSC family protein [Sphingomonas sanguinis]QXT36610.1 FUSC family protein [Sphingomonas sanguinis]
MTERAGGEGQLGDRYGLTRAIRRLGRRLELRSVSLIPEHLNRAEGYRGAVAVALPLILAIVTGRSEWGWAVYAAFWTCLCDVPGPDRLRRRLLGIFLVGGTAVALVGSWAASIAPHAGMIVGPLLVFLVTAAAGRLAFGGLVGTLSAVVAVVAVGFPHDLPAAARLSAAFFAGAAWSYLLINMLWRIDAFDPLRRATQAVSARLLDMADYLAGLRDHPHRDERWHRDHAEHRRAVRLAIERFREVLVRFAGEPGRANAARRELAAAETMFGALLALDQACIDRWGSAPQRTVLAEACRGAVASWCVSLRRRSRAEAPLEQASATMQRVRGELTEDVFRGCAAAFGTALTRLSEGDDEGEPAVTVMDAGTARSTPMVMVQQALRQAGGLVMVYYAAAVFGLGYPYWAAMAVIVVLQGGVRVTWARCLERIVGSLLGGSLAMALPLLGGGPVVPALVAVVLTALTMALRSVNYTIFVVFLTMLFVLVTDMLHPGVGIASARVVDNVVGSIAALLAVFAFRPDFGPPLPSRIEAGIGANRLYGQAVESDQPLAAIEAARRAAGRASVEAEIAAHDLSGWLHRLSHSRADLAGLQDMRNLAGRTAMAWHAKLGV